MNDCNLGGFSSMGTSHRHLGDLSSTTEKIKNATTKVAFLQVFW